MKHLFFIALIAVLAFALVGCSDNSPFDVNGKNDVNSTSTKEGNKGIKGEKVGALNEHTASGLVYPDYVSPDVYVFVYEFPNHYNRTGYDYWTGQPTEHENGYIIHLDYPLPKVTGDVKNRAMKLPWEGYSAVYDSDQIYCKGIDIYMTWSGK